MSRLCPGLFKDQGHSHRRTVAATGNSGPHCPQTVFSDYLDSTLLFPTWLTLCSWVWQWVKPHVPQLLITLAKANTTTWQIPLQWKWPATHFSPENRCWWRIGKQGTGFGHLWANGGKDLAEAKGIGWLFWNCQGEFHYKITNTFWAIIVNQRFFKDLRCMTTCMSLTVLYTYKWLRC